jgi:hypothetical protein
LVELVPDDRIELLSVFYAPNVPESARPTGWSTNTVMLDKFSDYVLSSNANSTVVVFEKPGLWRDGTVAVCFTNLSVTRMSTQAFKELLVEGRK